MWKDPISTIIFDIDGTLTTEVSWIKLTEFLWASKDEHLRIFSAFQKNELDYPTAKAALIHLWECTGNANRNFLMNTFRSWELRPEAREVITMLQKSYHICLMSGSVDLYVESVAETLGVSHWYANTTLIFDKHGLLVDFDYHREQAKKKLEHFQQYTQDYWIDLKECAIVGNGESDIELFRILPYGIAIDHDLDPEVKQLAHAVISNLRELKHYL